MTSVWGEVKAEVKKKINIINIFSWVKIEFGQGQSKAKSASASVLIDTTSIDRICTWTTQDVDTIDEQFYTMVIRWLWKCLFKKILQTYRVFY